MYPERIKKWFPGQTLTAERLNRSVNALNWLLGMAADSDADQPNDGATPISVEPPGGESPPTPNYQNPPADDITALGQPFKFTDEEVKILPPTVYGAGGYVTASTDGTPYYSVISTDKLGRIQSVSVSASPPSVRLWDGTNTGQLVACTGLLKKNEYEEEISVDANAVSVPVIPVFIPAGIGEISLVGAPTGNSIPIAGLRAGSGISLTQNSDNGAFVIDISATGGISSAEWSETATEPSISDGTLTLNLADANKPGGLKSAEFDDDLTELTISKGKMRIPPSNYNPSDPSVPPNPGYVKSVTVETTEATQPTAFISKGHIKILIPKTGAISSAEWSETATEPTISDGTLTLNLADSNKPGGIKSIEFDDNATETTISKGKATLPPANYNPSDPSVPPNPGYVKSVSVETTDSTQPTASISRGGINIQIPKTPDLSIENVTATYGTTAAPGVDGWIQTLYIEGSYQNGSLQYQRFDRQLMRFSGSSLQVVNQTKYPSSENPGWQPA